MESRSRHGNDRIGLETLDCKNVIHKSDLKPNPFIAAMAADNREL